MHRRSFVTVVTGVSAFGGCTRLGTIESGSDVPSPIDDRVTITDSRCFPTENGSRHRADAAYDDESGELTATGTIVTHKPCLKLDTRVETGVGMPDRHDDSIYVEIVYAGATDDGCDECEAEIDYELSVRFDGAPRTVSLYHLERIRGRDRRIGPIEQVEI